MIEKEFQDRVIRLYNLGKAQLESIGIEPSKNIRRLSINKRAKKRLGCCKATRKGLKTEYEIEISSMLQDCTDKEIMEVIIHELLHSCKGCMNHGAKWKTYSNQVKEKLGYNVTSRADYKELNLPPIKYTYKYEITCKSCGAKMYRTRKCNLTEHTDNYRCGKCKGILEVRSI